MAGFSDFWRRWASLETKLTLLGRRISRGALKNSTGNTDGGSSSANGKVDQFGANESSSIGSGTFRNAAWKSDPSWVSGNYGTQTSVLHGGQVGYDG